VDFEEAGRRTSRFVYTGEYINVNP
jgi:hypothetical protein